MAAALQLLKSISRRHQERHDLEMQMLVTQKSESRKRKLQMMEDDEIDTAKAIGLCAVRVKRPRKERSPDDQRHGYRNWDDSAFKKRLRINRATFQFILGEIEAQLVKEPTRFKPEPIPPDTQLAICLYRLAHGCTYSTVGDLFGVAESTASVIFNQVCKILVSTLYGRFVYLPRNSAEWKQELESFLENWEFPCVGAWDGLHVYVSTKLKNYFSFKKRYSVSSLGFIASNKRFLWAAVGAPGSTHDSRLLKSCDLFADIQQGRIFPSSVLRTKEYGDIPFTTVGNSAFPRYTWLVKPYSESTRDPRKRYLNKRLCSARVVSDHAYGMLKGRWRILYKKTECKLRTSGQSSWPALPYTIYALQGMTHAVPGGSWTLKICTSLGREAMVSKTMRQIRSGQESPTGSGISTSKGNQWSRRRNQQKNLGLCLYVLYPRPHPTYPQAASRRD